MYKDKKIIAIIPARHGSKGLPGKNWKILNGKPLIFWSVYQAKKSKFIDDIIVSTDSLKIINLLNILIPDVKVQKRKEHLSLDNTPMISVIEDVLIEKK